MINASAWQDTKEKIAYIWRQAGGMHNSTLDISNIFVVFQCLDQSVKMRVT